MTIDELSERLRVVDGFIPRDDLLTALRAGANAKNSVFWWKVVAAGFAIFAIASLASTIFMYYTATPLLIELAMYEKKCIEPVVAEDVVALASTVAEVNARCLAHHEDNYAMFQAFFAVQGSELVQEVAALTKPLRSTTTFTANP